MLAQGRHVNVENVESIINITAYFTAGYGVLWDFIGRGQDAYVYWRFDFAAEAAQLVIFQDAPLSRTSDPASRSFRRVASSSARVPSSDEAFCKMVRKRLVSMGLVM